MSEENNVGVKFLPPPTPKDNQIVKLVSEIYLLATYLNSYIVCHITM